MSFKAADYQKVVLFQQCMSFKAADYKKVVLCEQCMSFKAADYQKVDCVSNACHSRRLTIRK